MNPTPHAPETAEALFATFLEHVEEGRSVDFGRLCAEHPAQAERLERMHLRWSAMTRAFTALSTTTAHADADDVGSASMETLLARLRDPGDRVARYAIGDEIARGAMGRVVSAWDQDLGREVALKIQRDDVRDPRAQRRFLEEAQVTGQLDHPGIVPIHELGIDPAGRPYFAMRLVRGEDLGAVIERTRDGHDGWSRTRVLHVILRVCEAMEYAHDRGVVHRDLKPQNIMVGRFGETYVMDWGLAFVEGSAAASSPDEEIRTLRASIAAEDDVSPLLTGHGDVIGTPAYMAPEQAAGDRHELSRAVDVYAVGAILYALCAGRMPYLLRDESPTTRTILERLRAGPPRPLSDDVPAELRAIVDRAMARRPGDRYASMGELAADLRAFLELRVVKAYATGRYADLRKWVSRNRALSIASGLALLALVVGSIVSTEAWYSADRARRQADDTASRLAVELDRSEFRNARLLLGSDNAGQAEEILWRQHLLGGMPRATYWALVDAYERSPRVANVIAPGRANNPICFIAAQRLVAVGCDDGRVHLFDDVGLEARRVVGEPGPQLVSLATLPDADVLIAGSADGSVAFFESATGRVLRRVAAHAGTVRAIAIAPDGRRLVTGGADGRVLSWSDPGADPEEITKHTSPVWSLEFDASGARLASGDEKGAFWLTDLGTRTTQRWRLGSRNMMSIAFADGSSDVWVGSADQNLYVVDVSKKSSVRRIASRNGTCRQIVRDVDGSMIVGGWWRIDRFAADASSSRPITLQGVWRFDLDRATHRLATSSNLGRIALLDLSGGDRRLLGGTNVALSGDGRRIAVDKGGSVVVQSVDGSGDPATVTFDKLGGWLCMDRTGSRLAAMVGQEHRVEVFDVATRERLFTTEGSAAPGSNENFAFSPDGTELAVLVGSSTVRRLDSTTGAVRAEYRDEGQAVIRLRYEHEGALLGVLGIRPARLRLIALADGTHEDIDVGDAPSVVALSADRRSIGIADRTGSVYLLDRATGQRRRLGGQSGTVWSLSFSPVDPGLLVASTRADGVTFWDIDSGEACYKWTIDDSPIAQVQFSADGRTIAAYGAQGVVVRDLAYFDRHIAAGLGEQLERLRGRAPIAPAREASLRGWADGVLRHRWPRWRRD